MPATVTRDRAIGRDFHYWVGASGARYLHTVFAVADCPVLDEAVYIAVRRGRDGRRQALAVGLFGPFGGGCEIAAAGRLGADEIHVHLMAATPAARRIAVRDLAARHLAEAGSLLTVPVEA
jgi:hypothetical protein